MTLVALILTLSALGIQSGYSSSMPLETTNDPNYSIGNQLMEQRKWLEAEAVFKELLKKDPKSNLALTHLATALTELNRREEALELLKSAINRSKGSQRRSFIQKLKALSTVFLTNKTFQGYQDGINFMSSKKYRYARDKFERALTEEPENIEILVRLSQSLILENEGDTAIKKLIFAENLNPYQPEIELWLGKALLQKGLLSAAIVKLKAAHEGLRGSELAPIWLAESLYAAGQTSSAIHVLENDVKDWPYHLTSLTTLARLRSQAAHADSKSLWSARKELQVALSRLDRDQPSVTPLPEGAFHIDLRKGPHDFKAEIQKEIERIERQLEQSSDSH